MAKALFILGAGASADAKAPLIKGFLSKAEEVRGSSTLGADDKADFDMVFETLEDLKKIHSKSRLDFEDNIEVFFNLVEMGMMIGRLGDETPEQIGLLARAVRRVIVCTLEHSIRFPWDKGVISPTPTYREFVNFLGHLLGTDREVAVLSFNYDVALDYALLSEGVPFEYGLEPYAKRKAVRLLKLHGSLNWGECATCHDIVVADVGEYARWKQTYVGQGPFAQEECCLVISARLRAMEHKGCGGKMADLPAIIPPTWNKTRYHDQISKVWRHAAEELSDAEDIYVIGYSMPDTDVFFQYLIALGMLSKTRLKRFRVFDPNAAMEAAYRGLFPEHHQDKVVQKSVPFAEAMETIRQDFGIAPPGPGIVVLGTDDED